jgi:CRISPR-associated protein Cas2
MAHVLVMYDITNDRIRGKIADACMDYGLDRIQFSAFYGRLGRNHWEELMLRMLMLLGNETGKIELIPVSEDSWMRRLSVNQEGDDVGE